MDKEQGIVREGMVTNRGDLYASRITRPILKGLNKVMDGAKQRYPGESTSMALTKSPDKWPAVFGLTFAYSPLGAIQIAAELVELGIREVQKRTKTGK